MTADIVKSPEALASVNGVTLCYQFLRRRECASDPVDHGARDPDGHLGRGILRNAREAGISRCPIRQSRHRPVVAHRHTGAGEFRRADPEADARRSDRSALRVARHGGRRRRFARSSGNRARACGWRIDGRHDRAGNGHPFSAAHADADLDHVLDGQSGAAAADARGRGHADGAAAENARRISGKLRQDVARAARRAHSPSTKPEISSSPN